jgi:nuclear transport factor 2 (NTF2) superfamily protein
MPDRPPLPPFSAETAAQKVQAAEDAWNSRDPERVSLAYSEDSVWRNRNTFVTGRAEIVRFLTGKWERELEVRAAQAPVDVRGESHRRPLPVRERRIFGPRPEDERDGEIPLR